MLDIKGKKIVVVGAQKSSMAVARLAGRLGAVVKISEKKKLESLTPEFRQWIAQTALAAEFGGNTRDFIEDSDILVTSPGVPIGAEPLEWARQKGIPVLGEIEFAAQFCTKPIIAVTGSNGKTTVSTLIHEVLSAGGLRSVLCGNIGLPFSDFVLDLDDKDFVVLEVSSFQLEILLDPSSAFRKKAQNGKLSFAGLRPYVAVFLNFSGNHLDRHKDLQEYFDAKKKIFLNQESSDYAVLDYGNPQLKDLRSQIVSEVMFFNQQKDGWNNPNYSAVSAVARILEIKQKVCEKVFEEFKGVEHRMEWVRSLGGVDFINDSKSTTAVASRWALEHIQKPVIMICGGRDKNIDYSILKDIVRTKVRKMVVFGEARGKIKEVFSDIISVEECQNLENAVLAARQGASEGDCVLLSPMCASFDMFANFEERGRIYKQLVKNLV